MDITRTHDAYPDRKARLDFALAHYEGDVYEPVATAPNVSPQTRRGTVVGLKAEPFLVMHGQGESEAAFAERRRISTHTPHLAFAVDSLAGMVLAREAEAERTWETDDGPGVLGDPETPGTVAARLWEDADGAGTNWTTQFAQLAPHLVVARQWFQHVVPPPGGEPEASAAYRHVLVDPRHVIDWHAPGGRLEWAVVREEAEGPRLPGEEAAPVVSFLALHVDGWERWEKPEEGEPVRVAEGAWSFVDRNGRPTVPARFASVPIRRDLGYQMAREANGLLNLASTRDFRLWTANVNRLAISADPNDWAAITDNLKAGSTVIFTSPDGQAEFIHPSQEPAIASDEILGGKVKAFYHTFFRSYDDEGRQRTATEIRQEAQSGTNAFLSMLAQALDEAENWALYILEQAVAPERPDEWGRAYVSRTRRFDPAPPEAQAEALFAQVFGGQAVPLGKTGRTSAAKRLADLHNLEADDDEIEAAVEAADARPAVRPGRLDGMRRRMQFDPDA